MLAKADLYGVAALITALVGFASWLATQLAKYRSSRAVKAALAAKGVAEGSIDNRFVVLDERRSKAMDAMQTEITELREEVRKCQKDKAQMMVDFQTKLEEAFQSWRLAPPSS